MRFLAFLSLVGLAVAVNRTVYLDYATYVGSPSQSTDVTAWKGIRYAAAPVGTLRFLAPQDPVTQSGHIKANSFAPGCLEVDGTKSNTSEDCLFLNVFAPANAVTGAKLPVWFYIHGGGFATNANSALDGTKLIQAANNSLVIVTLNYRLGPFGFLDGKEVQAHGSSNNGLKDQLKAMQWTKKYIENFGGDPGHIVIGGESAGAQSVALHLTAYGGKGEPLFVGATAQSVSSPTMYKSVDSQPLYNALRDALKCPSTTESFECIQRKTVDEIQAVNKRNLTKLPGDTSAPPIYLWTPTVDGGFVPDYTYNLYKSLHFYNVPVLMGADRNDGRTFIQPKNSYAECNTTLRDNFPKLTNANLEDIGKFYPLSDYEHYAHKGLDSYWAVCAQAYGDLRYKCPGVNFLTFVAYNLISPTWEYEYRAVDPSNPTLGTPHTAEVNAIWDTGVGSYAPGGHNAPLVPMMQAYWTSFIRSLDPNVHRRLLDPQWGQWDEQRKIIYLNTTTTLGVRNEHDDDICKFFLKIGSELQQ